MAAGDQPIYSLRQLVFNFLKLGYSGFGGPVALVGYMHADLVEDRKWITEEEYKEGLSLAQLAPGPLAAQLGIYLGFVHYRFIGATLTGLAFVFPSFLMVVGIGIAYKIYGGLPWMQAVFYGIGAAVIVIITMSIIIPFLHGSVVTDFQWLNDKQFLDAVAVAMITPGPVVITVGFIGYLVAGFPGATVAALATFLPCYFMTLAADPYYKKIAQNQSIKSFVDGITAAVVGALVGAVIIIAFRSIVDFPTALIAVFSVLSLIYLKKLKEPYIILIAAVIGLLINLS